MLSGDMESFLAAELEESVAARRRWRVIGNQTVMAKRIAPKLDDPFFAELRKTLDEAGARTLDRLTRSGRKGLLAYIDSWNGYPAARERFYKLGKAAGARAWASCSSARNIRFWAGT